ncbi:unnamed protein product [Adineta ricciae]|uniref:G-protein coupled receptors family 1 profile domain-containing protein n=1 Tax=Adineta ricciae TaxID=249248 RepID=A0A814E931_ADIRI|nr:unnamed protein product [Adineta ricciae]
MLPIDLVNAISTNFSIYVGLSILIAGLIGNCFNILVFLSLKTFRDNSCAFYLTAMSFLNIGQLLTSLLPRIMNLWFAIDWSLLSIVYCKIRIYLFQLCTLSSFTCTSLATIDQFLATCSHPRWHKFNNIKTAYRLFILIIFIWMCHGIPLLVYQDLFLALSTGEITCAITNNLYQNYVTYGFNLTLVSSLPLSVTTIFGLLAYHNVTQIAYRTVPLVRRELDKQLTVMVLLQVFCNFFIITPYIIVTAIFVTVTYDKDSYRYAQMQLARSITITAFYLYFTMPFYIYICISERFRRQFLHVFFGIYSAHRRRRRRMTINPLPLSN